MTNYIRQCQIPYNFLWRRTAIQYKKKKIRPRVSRLRGGALLRQKSLPPHGDPCEAFLVHRTQFLIKQKRACKIIDSTNSSQISSWASWIRTNVMQESKSCALPLGDSPIIKETKLEMRYTLYLITAKKSRDFINE